MNISTRIVIAALNHAYSLSAGATPATGLRAKLVSLSADAFQVIGGGAVKSTSGNGHEVTFAGGQDAQGPTVGQVSEMYVWLVEIFDASYAAIGGTPSDATVQTEMVKRLRPITGYTSNWKYLQK